MDDLKFTDAEISGLIQKVRKIGLTNYKNQNTILKKRKKGWPEAMLSTSFKDGLIAGLDALESFIRIRKAEKRYAGSTR